MRALVCRQLLCRSLVSIISVLIFGSSSSTHATITITDAFVILTGGPSGSSYYYNAAGSSTNTSFNSISQNINLLVSPAITLNGGEVKTTATGGDYQNSNNYERLIYRFYNSGSSAPSYTTNSLTFRGENPSYPNYKWDVTGQTTQLLNGSESSGTYYFDVYFEGNGSWWNGSQQYFTGSENTDGSSSNPNRATFNLFYGATANGTQASAFTGSGYFNFNGSGQTYTLNQNNTYSGETQIQAGTVALSGSGAVGNSSVVRIAANSTFDISGVTTSASVNALSEYGTSNGGSVKLGSKTLIMNGGTASTTYQMKSIGVSGDTGAFTLNAANSSVNLRTLS